MVLYHIARCFVFTTFLVTSHSPISYAQLDDTTQPEVTIPQGTLVGTTVTTRHGRNISGFLGIPYAQPPIGNLRFANPVAADAWNGTLDATTEPNMCPQISSTVMVGAEDCLFVKVYTPQLPRSSNDSLLPVMVFIHGGGFIARFPYDSGPEYLLDADVVLVVLNYRLGPLGFLSTGDEVASGNWGLKDQVLALRWVQSNVQYFGGDPDQVTVFGESGGGGSIHLLALSNTTIGLFHRYITQSGSALADWAHRPRAPYSSLAFALGVYVDCTSNTSESLISCLRTVEFSDIIATLPRFTETSLDFVSTIAWGPTDEPDIEGAILTDSPTDLIAAGRIRDLPWMSGVVRDEGLLLTEALYENDENLNEFLESFDTVLPFALSWRYQYPLWATRLSAMKSYYFNNNMTSNSSELVKNLTDIVSDSMFFYPAHKALRLHHALAKTPQYFYTFDYRGSCTITDATYGLEGNYGVRHGDELFYLFPMESLCSIGNNTFSEEDYEMVDIMVQLWTSFAINGTPTTSASGDGVTWEPYSTEDNYLKIGNESDLALEVQYSFFPDRMQFWDTIDPVAGTDDESGTVTSTPNLLFLLAVAGSSFIR